MSRVVTQQHSPWFLRYVRAEVIKLIPAPKILVFQLLCGMLLVVLSGLAILAGGGGVNPAGIISFMTVAGLVIASVAGATIATSDTSYGDVQTYFVFEQYRWRVVVSKVVATLISYLVTVAFLLGAVSGVTIVTSVIVGSNRIEYVQLKSSILSFLVVLALAYAVGLAIGIAIQKRTLAVILALSQQLFFEISSAIFLPPWLAPYIRLDSVHSAILGEGSVGPALVALTLWVIAPLFIGTSILQKRDF